MEHLDIVEFNSRPPTASNTPMVEYGREEPEDGTARKRTSMGLSRFVEKIRFKKREEEDEALPSVPWLELLKLNLPDWYLAIPGVLAAGAIGALFPVLAVLFSGALEVCAMLSVGQLSLMCYVSRLPPLHRQCPPLPYTELWQH